MGRRLVALTVLLYACQARLGDGPGADATDAPVVDAPSPDGAPDVTMLGAWGAPTKVLGASTAQAEDDATMSDDTLEMIFAVNENGTKHLWSMTRTSPLAEWNPPARMTINSPVATNTDDTPRLAVDGLTLYFESDRGGNNGDIYKSTRSAVGANWQPPTVLADVSSPFNEKWFMPCGPAGRYMLVSNRDSGMDSDLYEGTLGGGPPTRISELNSAQSETGTFLTQDCLTIMFASARSGNTLLYQSHRMSATAAWSTPTLVTDFITGADQQDPWMSADGRTFVFASNPGNNYDIFISTR